MQRDVLSQEVNKAIPKRESIVTKKDTIPAQNITEYNIGHLKVLFL